MSEHVCDDPKECGWLQMFEYMGKTVDEGGFGAFKINYLFDKATAADGRALQPPSLPIIPCNQPAKPGGPICPCEQCEASCAT